MDSKTLQTLRRDAEDICRSAIEASVPDAAIQRALAQLEAEDLVRTERTSGRFVTEDTDLIEQLRAAAARNIAADFLEKMRSIGYTPQQAAELLRSWNVDMIQGYYFSRPLPPDDLLRLLTGSAEMQAENQA